MTKKPGVGLAILLFAQMALTQTPPSKTDVERRLDSIVDKMTVDEKIEIIGGINDFCTRAIPRRKLDRRAFSFYDITKKAWSAEPGEFSILVGGSSDKIELRSALSLTRQTSPRSLVGRTRFMTSAFRPTFWPKGPVGRSVSFSESRSSNRRMTNAALATNVLKPSRETNYRFAQVS